MTSQIVIGMLSGLAVAVIFVVVFEFFLKSREQEPLKDNMQEIINALGEKFSALSMETLKAQVEMAEKMMNEKKSSAENALEEKKRLIDQRLEQVGKSVAKIETLMQAVNSKTGENGTAIITELRNAREASVKLEAAANNLREMLGSSQKRGEWGQRAAEDIFNIAGVTKGKHYITQTQQESGSKPDFTFFLPHGKKVNIDVKFPLDNFTRYVAAETSEQKEALKAQYLKDVRGKLKDLAKKDYVSEAEGTVDYMVMFIPNEQVYAFVGENDRAFMDDALKSKIIVCGPYTLYAVVSTIREAVNNFQMAQAAGETRELMEKFRKEWKNYTEIFDEVADAVDTVYEGFSRMASTRKKKLEAVLEEISELGQAKEIGQPKPAREEAESSGSKAAL